MRNSYYIDGTFPVVPSMFHQNLRCLEIKNPCKLLTYKGLFVGVPSRTRTDDIQNHNLTL